MDADIALCLPTALANVEAELKCEPEGSAVGLEEFTVWGKSIAVSLELIYEMAKAAGKTPEMLVPEFETWCKDVGEVLTPWRQCDWKEWCPAWLVPSVSEDDAPMEGQEGQGGQRDSMDEEEVQNSAVVEGDGDASKRAAFLERESVRAANIKSLQAGLAEARANAEAQKKAVAKKAGRDFAAFNQGVKEINEKLVAAEMSIRKQLQDVEKEKKWDEDTLGLGEGGIDAEKADKGGRGDGEAAVVVEKEDNVEKAEKGDKEMGKGKKTSRKAKVFRPTIVASNPIAQKRKAMDPSELQALEDAEHAEDVEEESEEGDDKDEREVVNKNIECLLCLNSRTRVCRLYAGTKSCTECQRSGKKCDFRGLLDTRAMAQEWRDQNKGVKRKAVVRAGKTAAGKATGKAVKTAAGKAGGKGGSPVKAAGGSSSVRPTRSSTRIVTPSAAARSANKAKERFATVSDEDVSEVVEVRPAKKQKVEDEETKNARLKALRLVLAVEEDKLDLQTAVVSSIVKKIKNIES